MGKIRVAINGLGRIGRAFLKVAKDRPELELVAANELGDIENMAYLLKFDTVYGKSDFEIKVERGKEPALFVSGKKIIFLSEKDPARLPWGKLEIDVVVESTGRFVSHSASKVHLDAGAKRVVITAPFKTDNQQKTTSKEKAEENGATVLLGVNEEKLQTCVISSNASCTTNAGSPLVAILDETIGIEKAILNTVHGYTASQSLVDGPSAKDWREGRAGAQNIVPSSTGAAIATTKAFTKLAGKFDGIAVRVPVVAGSLVDITFIAKRRTTKEEVNEILRAAAAAARWKNIFTVTDEPLVSSDILGSPYGSIADLPMTRVVDGTLVKVLAWYDNEMGYTHTLVEHVVKAGKLLKF